MKFLVITDIHGDTSVPDMVNSVSEEYDIDRILILGDITNFGPNEVAENIIGRISHKVYAIPGNCDPLDLPAAISGICTDMHGRSATVGGIHFAGLGGSNPTIFDTSFELDEETIYNMLKPISKKGMVLMVHAPAHGINDTIPSGLHVGSTSILKIVDEFEPRLVLSGHIHEAIGMRIRGKTVFINPGPAKDGRYAIVEMKNGGVSAELFGPDNKN